MNTIIVLLVLVVIDGEAHTFAAQTAGLAECMVLESKIASVLPKALGKPPQFYAAKCAEVVPFVTAL